MNWYLLRKFSQIQLSLLEEKKTDTGSGTLPPLPPDDDGKDDDERFEPDQDMIMRVYKWIQDGHAKDIIKTIIDTVLSKQDFKYSLYPSHNKDITYPFIMYGEVNLTFEHTLTEQDVEFSLLLNNMKNTLLHSNLWKYLGIPYEQAFSYTQNEFFTEFILFTIVGSSLFTSIPQCAFWAYEEAPKYINIIKKTILDIYGKKYPNLDPNSLKIEPGKQPECHGSYFHDQRKIYLRSWNKFSFFVSVWKFEQKTGGTPFEQIDPKAQKSIMGYIDSVLESVYEEIWANGAFENESIDIYISSGKAYEELTFDISPSYVLYSKNINEEESLKEIVEKYGNKIIEIIGTIPEQLIKMSVQNRVYQFPTDQGQEETDLSLSIKGIKLQNNEIIIKIGLDVY
jgi:hypothetical protein